VFSTKSLAMSALRQARRGGGQWRLNSFVIGNKLVWEIVQTDRFA